MIDLKKRKVGIKKIEHQYIDRIKSAKSPTRKSYTTGVKHVKAAANADKLAINLYHQVGMSTPSKHKGLGINQALKQGGTSVKDRNQHDSNLMGAGLSQQNNSEFAMEYKSVNGGAKSELIPADNYDSIAGSGVKKIPQRRLKKKNGETLDQQPVD